MWRRGPKGNSAACSALSCLSVTSSISHKQIGPFWCWFLGGWVCVRSRSLWVSPRNSPVRLGVSPAAITPHRVFQLGVLRLYFPTLEPWFAQCFLLPSFSSMFIHMQMWAVCSTNRHLVLSSSCCLAVSPLRPGYPSLPLLLVWMNSSSLTPWLLDFHTVRFFGSSGWFLFLNLLLSFFWLCKEAQCIYVCLNLVQKPMFSIFNIFYMFDAFSFWNSYFVCSIR